MKLNIYYRPRPYVLLCIKNCIPLVKRLDNRLHACLRVRLVPRYAITHFCGQLRDVAPGPNSTRKPSFLAPWISSKYLGHHDSRGRKCVRNVTSVSNGSDSHCTLGNCLKKNRTLQKLRMIVIYRLLLFTLILMEILFLILM